MKTPLRTGSSLNRFLAVLFGLALTLAGTGIGRAMSELVSITLEPQWPTNTNPGTVTLYSVTVTRAGQGVLDVSLTAGGLPAGATAAFGQDSLRFTGRSPETLTTTLALTCPEVTATDKLPFTITGTSFRDTLTVTNQSQTANARLAGSADGTLLLLDRLIDGRLMIRGHGPVSGVYQVEATSDLAAPAWEPVAATSADGNGRFICINPAPVQSGACFYRTINPGQP